VEGVAYLAVQRRRDAVQELDHRHLHTYTHIRREKGSREQENSGEINPFSISNQSNFYLLNGSIDMGS
jgi:hypothetical protein